MHQGWQFAKMADNLSSESHNKCQWKEEPSLLSQLLFLAMFSKQIFSFHSWWFCSSSPEVAVCCPLSFLLDNFQGKTQAIIFLVSSNTIDLGIHECIRGKQKGKSSPLFCAEKEGFWPFLFLGYKPNKRMGLTESSWPKLSQVEPRFVKLSWTM